jgi:pimeloyl-ACP methyl ester carboxylesterase
LHDGAAFSLASAFQRFLVPSTIIPVTNVPTLALWGLADRSHASTDRASSAALSRDCRIVELLAIGHFPELEDPARFAELVREFDANL